MYYDVDLYGDYSYLLDSENQSYKSIRTLNAILMGLGKLLYFIGSCSFLTLIFTGHGNLYI